jgi:hypothetical protein
VDLSKVSCSVVAGQELLRAETKGPDFPQPTHTPGFAHRPSPVAHRPLGPFQAAVANLFDINLAEWSI